MYRKIVIAISAIFIFGGIARATPVTTSPCNNANTEAEMYDCLTAELKKSDGELNSAYKTLIDRYKADGQSTESQYYSLRQAQRAWLKLRDTSCDFETYDSRLGSGFGTIYTACLLQHTQKRVEYLQWYIKHP